ncbi:MAG: T9SS type A sorting domain-containing protein [Bacteroidia bacterium]|nr:T9SS type A sorting domain-containing protein [Bacteroidia bacterium]
MNFKITFIVLLSFLLSVSSIFAQLSSGDIAFVEYNADNTDQFAFVALVEIPGSTIIYFTDNEVSNLSSGEGTLTWEAPVSGLPCGTIVTIDKDRNTDFGTITNERNNFDLGGGGDAIIAFQGTDNVTASTYLAAISNDGGSWGGSKDGDLPSGLTNGTDAIAINPEIDNVKYDGSILIGDKASLLAAINDNSNWSGGSNSNNQDFEGTFYVSECIGASCFIELVASNISSCNDNSTNANSADDYYTVDITAVYFNVPATGTLDLSGDITGASSVNVSALPGNSYTYSSVVVPADGSAKTINVSFSDEGACAYSLVLDAVSSCSSVIPAGYVYFDNESGDNNWNTALNWSDNSVPLPYDDNIYIGAGFNVVNNTGNDIIFDKGFDFQLFGTLDMEQRKLEMKTSGGYLLIGSTGQLIDASEFYMTISDGLVEDGAFVETEHLKVSDDSEFTINASSFTISNKIEIIGSAEIVGTGCILWNGNDYTNTGNGIFGCTGSESDCMVSGTNYICALGSFPVEFESFVAKESLEGVALSWTTASESNNDYFQIQKSQDNELWEDIAKVSGKGTTSTSNDYEFVDNNPFLGMNYYRLKQVDIDGAFSYSDTRQVLKGVETGSQFSVYPNPLESGESFNIQLTALDMYGDLQVEIYDLKGVKLLDRKFSLSEIEKAKESLRVNNSLNPGAYLVLLKSGSFRSVQKLLIK